MTLEEAQSAGIISNLTYETWMEVPSGTTYIDGPYTYTYLGGSVGDYWRFRINDKASSFPLVHDVIQTINGKDVAIAAGAYEGSRAEVVYLDTLDISRLINMQDMFKYSAVSRIIARTSADANRICTEANATGALNTSVISVYVQNTKICEFDCEQEAMH